MAHLLKSSKSVRADRQEEGALPKENPRSSPKGTQRKGILSKFTKKRTNDESYSGSYDDSFYEDSGKKKHKRKHQNRQGPFYHLYTYITKVPVSFNTYDYLHVFPILDVLPINRPSLVFLNSLHIDTLKEISKTFCTNFSMPHSQSSPSCTGNLASSSSLPSSFAPSYASRPLSLSSPSPLVSGSPSSSLIEAIEAEAQAASTPPVSDSEIAEAPPAEAAPASPLSPSSSPSSPSSPSPSTSPSSPFPPSSPSPPLKAPSTPPHQGRTHKFGASISPSLINRVHDLCSVPITSDYRVHGAAIATYPKLCHSEVGMEHLIADSWMCLSFGNRMYFGISDGIGHGPGSQKSAISGLLGLLSHLVFSHFSDPSPRNDEGEPLLQIDEVSLFQSQKWFNVPQALKSVIESFQVAQTLIINTTDEMTALTGGMLVEIEPSSSPPIPNPQTSSACFKWNWAFVGASLGDCKVYRYSKVTEQVLEVTSDDESKISLRDAGGHLGVECLLANLTCYFCPVDEGDFIICLTDGVHDNLDPETLRIPPANLGIPADSWRRAGPEALAIRRKFRETRISQILGLNALQPGPPLTPEDITNRILEYVNKTTENLRSGEEKGAILQRDWETLGVDERMKMKNDVIRLQKTAPGKYDHSTCLTIMVQRHPEAERKVANEESRGRGKDEVCKERSRSSIFLLGDKVCPGSLINGAKEKEKEKEKENEKEKDKDKEEEEEKEKEKEKEEEEKEQEEEKREEKGKVKEIPKRHKKAKSSGNMGRVLKGVL